MVEDLTKKGIFVRELQSHDIPYHSEYLITSAKRLTDELKKVVLKPKTRSRKWVSTAIIDSDPDDVLKTASAEYFVHNLISPVYFYNKVKYLPMDAIIIEIGPHGLFSKIISQTLDAANYISFIKKDSNETNMDMLLSGIAKLYELGLNPNIEKLYPKVEFPVVRGTQSIASLVKWDHGENYFVRKWPDFYFKGTSSEMTENINLKREIKSFLPDHCIDGNCLFPATGYLMCAWRQMAAFKGRLWNQIPVIFEDVQFRRPVFVSQEEPTKLKVRYMDQTGNWHLL
jgi:fatty acid synthase